MEVISIQGLMEKLQTHEERVIKIQEDVSTQTFFQIKIVLDVPKEVEYFNKTKKEEVGQPQQANLLNE